MKICDENLHSYIYIYANLYMIYADVKSNIKQEIKDLVAASYKLL